jgi:anti-anti-sigma factor
MSGVDVERINGVPVARPRGDIDAANANRVREKLAECITGNGDSLIVDLSDTRYVDSAGIDMLFRLSERLRQRRVQLSLVIPAGADLARLAEIVALPRVVAIHETVDEALDGLSRRRRTCGAS